MSTILPVRALIQMALIRSSPACLAAGKTQAMSPSADNNFTFAGIGTNNLTYSGPISSTSGTIFIGRAENVTDEGVPPQPEPWP